MSAPLTTVRHYEIGLTADLSDDQASRLAGFLSDLSKEAGGQYHGAIVFGKFGETQIDDFRPLTLKTIAKTKEIA